MSMSKVVKANMRQACFLKDFSRGMADHMRVQRAAIWMAEYQATVG